MKLPHGDSCVVDRRKITEYLLPTTHPDGAAKAAFFLRFGFVSGDWPVLADALREHGQAYEVTNSVASEYGVRYTVDGALRTPDGRNPVIRTVWMTEEGSESPRLITAHPL